jgi:hypothetical protein
MRVETIRLYAFIVLVSLLLSLCLTAGYGWFQHRRYYDNTNLWTQQNQIKFAISLLELTEAKSKDSMHLSVEDLVRAFDPMKRFMPVDVFLNGKLYWGQRDPRKVDDRPVLMGTNELNIGHHKIVFGTYGRPAWLFGKKARFWEKLFSPNQWFSWRADYFSVPFAFFFGTVFFFLWGSAFWYRAKHVDGILLKEIQKLTKED